MSVQPDAATRLATVLEAEETLVRELHQLLQNERQLMADLDAAGLEALVARKESLAAEGRLLEESRQAVCRDIEQELGIPDSPAPLRALLGALDASDALRRQYARLQALLASVQELVEANRAVAGEALSGVQGTLRLLGRLRPDSATYGPAPAAGDASEVGFAPGRLLRRTA